MSKIKTPKKPARKARKKAAPKKPQTPKKPGSKRPLKKPPEGWLTAQETCDLLGIVRTTLDFAVRRGRLTAWRKVGTRKYFDPVAIKDEFENNVDGRRRANSQKAKVAAAKERAKDPASFQNYLDQKRHEIEQYAAFDYDKVPAQEAERREKAYKAKLAELKFLEQSGKLVEREAVERKFFELSRQVRDALLTIPARLSPELAAETDPHAMERKLTKELNASLRKLSEGKPL